MHADLEYHRELETIAVNEFKNEIATHLGKLPPEERERIFGKKPAASPEPKIIPDEEPAHEELATLPAILEEQPPSPDESRGPTLVKSKELKTLFHRIAEETHPDKVRANGFSEKEVTKRTRIFKKAKKAFNETNWYILHSIANQIGVEVPKPTEQLIGWLEEDIARVENDISNITNLTAWHWYHGNKRIKQRALTHFFTKVYGISLPTLQ